MGRISPRAPFFSNVAVTVELPGTSANTRTDSRTPVLFVRKTTDEQEAEDSRSAGNEPVNQYRLVFLRLAVAGGKRVVFGFKVNPIAAKPKLVVEEVPTLTEQIAGGAWRKITPQQPLANGEYALGFINEDGTEAFAGVYDFGVGPASPVKKP